MQQSSTTYNVNDKASVYNNIENNTCLFQLYVSHPLSSLSSKCAYKVLTPWSKAGGVFLHHISSHLRLMK